MSIMAARMGRFASVRPSHVLRSIIRKPIPKALAEKAIISEAQGRLGWLQTTSQIKRHYSVTRAPLAGSTNNNNVVPIENEKVQRLLALGLVKEAWDLVRDDPNWT